MLSFPCYTRCILAEKDQATNIKLSTLNTMSEIDVFDTWLIQ